MKDELLIKFLLKETNTEENIRVQKWLSENDANATYFNQFKKIWEAAENQSKTDDVVDVDQAWLSFKAKVVRKTSTKPIVKPLNVNLRWMSIAACIILAIGAWAIYNLSDSNSNMELASADRVITEKLPDGSELTLNKNSTISFAKKFTNNRKIKLKKGEVFFDVMPDKSHPFVIEIDQVAVQVVGTSFNIKRSKTATSIVVETGIVTVTKGKNQVKLVKGEQLTIKDEASKLVKEPVPDQLHNYYRSNMFIAKNTPLYRLVDVLNEAYGSNVTVADEVKDLTIYIPLPFGSLDENLNIICATLNLKIKRNQKQILLSY